MTNRTLRLFFNRMNRAYWGGRLCASRVRFTKLPKKVLGKSQTIYVRGKDHDTCYVGTGEVSTQLQQIPVFAILTLAHEMVHIAKPKAWCLSNRPTAFHREFKRVLDAGLYRLL